LTKPTAAGSLERDGFGGTGNRRNKQGKEGAKTKTLMFAHQKLATHKPSPVETNSNKEIRRDWGGHGVANSWIFKPGEPLKKKKWYHSQRPKGEAEIFPLGLVGETLGKQGRRGEKEIRESEKTGASATLFGCWKKGRSQRVCV